MTSKRLGTDGLTVVELLFVVSIIAILASVAIPKYMDVIQKSQEGGVKGNLGSLRSALQIYYGDNGINYPTCVAGPGSTVFSSVLTPNYIDKIPPVKSGLHPSVSTVYCDSQMIAGSIHDGQGWYYDGVSPLDSSGGGVWVACDHTDSKGTIWTSY